MDQRTDLSILNAYSAQPYHHPVKLVSKSIPMSRVVRLRLGWFSLGVLVSLAVQGILPSLSPDATQQAAFELEETPAEEEAASIDASMSAVDKVDESLTANITTPIELNEESDVDTSATRNTAQDEKEIAAQYPMKLTLTVKNGDTLSTLLDQLGVSAEESQHVVEAVRKHYNLKKLAIGQDIHVDLDQAAGSDQPIVTSMYIPLSVISSLRVTRTADQQFDVNKQNASIERKPVYASGEINSSLYETGIQQGIPATVIASVINAYSYDVDFQRDIHNGDKIGLLYEKLETDRGDDAGTGNILFARLNTGNHDYLIYRFVDSSGDADFYNSKGESVRKGLLRTPINGARITSRFGMRRHPILGYSKMHRGVDFGAPIGTPIYAAGDGTIAFAGRKGGYGNFLKIQHNGTYATGYGHIHRFASGIYAGKKVKQGQVVAYVGNSGLSTGPHLHYEVIANGAQVNPSNIKFKTGRILAGKELASFRKHITEIDATVATLDKTETKVALLQKK